MFIAPNQENITYTFDYQLQQEISFWRGTTHPLSSQGFDIMSRRLSGRGDCMPPRWYTVKEYEPRAAGVRVNISGRFLVSCPEMALPEMEEETPRGQPEEACAFRVCTRGRPVYRSTRTKTFTHTAQVITSGLFFVLYIEISQDSLFVCPRIMVVLESGEEVILVDDRLGPLRAPQSFFADFALLDDGGRNVQMDLIFRAAPQPESIDEEPESRMRTLRTCLQEYTTFNNQVEPANMSLGSSDLTALLPSAAVYLQNLVASEEPFEGKDTVCKPRPFNAWRDSKGRAKMGNVLFEGADAKLAAIAEDLPEAPQSHPQLFLRGGGAPGRRGGSGAARGSNVLAAFPATLDATKSTASGADESSTEDFWYHIRYNDDKLSAKPRPLSTPYLSRLRGEFWLSKQAVDKKHVYFHCSTTLMQALTMCVVFRFSCPTDFLALIQTKASCVLRDTHIPTNGVVLGIEADPRHVARNEPLTGLYRMFIEHRNEILDDMVVCECRLDDLRQTIAHQEIYDGGPFIVYRLTLVYPDGSRQSSVLQMDAEQLEENTNDENKTNRYHLVEEPSPRFPISPCLVRHQLSPANRVFVYSASSYEPPPPEAADEADGCENELWHEEVQSCTDYATPEVGSRKPGSSEQYTAEDWQSVGGGYSSAGECPSDGEQSSSAADTARGPQAPRGGGRWDLARAIGGCSSLVSDQAGDSSRREEASADLQTPRDVAWRRPLMESVVLLEGVEAQPFRCVPGNME